VTTLSAAYRRQIPAAPSRGRLGARFRPRTSTGNSRTTADHRVTLAERYFSRLLAFSGPPPATFSSTREGCSPTFQLSVSSMEDAVPLLRIAGNLRFFRALLDFWLLDHVPFTPLPVTLDERRTSWDTRSNPSLGALADEFFSFFFFSFPSPCALVLQLPSPVPYTKIERLSSE